MGLLETLRQSFRAKPREPSQTAHLTVRGYGVEAIPLVPFSAIHLDDGTIVFGPAPHGPARSNVLLAPGREPRSIGLYLIDETDNLYALGSTEPDTTALILPPGEKDARGALADYRTVMTRSNEWYVRTELYEMGIPMGFTLRSDGRAPSGEEPFDFAVEPACLVSVLGPFLGRSRVPRPDHFAPRAADYADQGTLAHVPEAIPWFEFGFKQEGRARRQRFYELIADPLAYTVYFLRAQGPRDGTEQFFAACDKMAKSFAPTVR